MVESSNTSATRTRGRPRSDATNEAIVHATLELLESENYQDVSIDKIAAQAKVGKQTIYRRWNSKASLLLEVMTERIFNRMVGVVPSGDALSDIEDLLKRYFVQLRHPLADKGFRAMVAEAQFDADFREKFYSGFVNDRRYQVRELLQAGVEVGQVRSDLSLDLAVDILFGGIWFRLLSGAGAPLDDAFAKELVGILKPYLVK
jgi:AcrR family transcriptional regulator